MKSSSETLVFSSGSDRTLVIMAKAPRPGAVKTRLAASLSPTDFYCCLLDDMLTLARSLGDVEVAIMCPDSDVNELAQLAGNKASVVAQKGCTPKTLAHTFICGIFSAELHARSSRFTSRDAELTLCESLMRMIIGSSRPCSTLARKN